jgi:hypothetical protein
VQQQHEREMSARGSFTSFSDLLPGGSGKRRETASAAVMQQQDLEAELDSLLRDEGRWDDEDDDEEEQEVITFEPPKRADSKKDIKAASTAIAAVDEKKRTAANITHKSSESISAASDADSTAWNFSDETRRRKVQEEAARTFHPKEEFYDDKLMDDSECSEDGSGSATASGVYEEIRF